MLLPKLPFGLSMNKRLLLCGNILFGIVFIVLQNSGILPLDTTHFVFFSFVVLLFALYRPGWAFLLFIGMLPYEVITLGVPLAGMELRPYQWLTLLLFVALSIRLVTRKMTFRLFRPQWFDVLSIVIALGAFLPALTSFGGNTIKQGLVVTSFVGIYFLGRIFFRATLDLKQALPFFLGSSVVVCAYSIWQNIRFLSGEQSYQVMAGRPNATFSEADWLGLFAVVAIALLWTLLVAVTEKKSESLSLKTVTRKPLFWCLFFLQILSFIVIIIAVSRSAWIALAGVGLSLTLTALVYHRHNMRMFFSRALLFGANTVVAFLCAVSIIYFFHLTSFQLFQRIESTTGLQQITISCKSGATVPKEIQKVEDLAPLGCEHILLEDIEREKELGNVVATVYRPDPNVSIRKEIYGKVWGIITTHPLLGIGWGNATTILGSDERGAGLNASNMFLEVWLGSGILGLIAFMILWGLIAFAALYGTFFEPGEERFFSFFIWSGWVGITIFNMFNSGMLLGFFFIFLALGVLNAERVILHCKKR